MYKDIIKLIEFVESIIYRYEEQKSFLLRGHIISYQVGELKKVLVYMRVFGRKGYAYEYIVSLSDLIIQWIFILRILGRDNMLYKLLTNFANDNRLAHIRKISFEHLLILHDLISILVDEIILLSAEELMNDIKKLGIPLLNFPKSTLSQKLSIVTEILCILCQFITTKEYFRLNEFRDHMKHMLYRELEYLSLHIDCMSIKVKSLMRNVIEMGDVVSFLIGLGILRVLEKIPIKKRSL